MNFEQLQSTWSAQPPAAPAARDLDLAKLTRTLAPEINRRRRFLGYTIFVAILCLVLSPLFAVANYRHAPPAHPVWHWTYFASWIVIVSGILVSALRAFERHGAVRAQSTRSLRDLALATLASVDAEMRDCRLALWIVPPLLLFQLTDLFVKFPPHLVGWQPFLGRAAFVLGLSATFGLAFWRHYRSHLGPTRVRQQELLRELA
jgi:hypothetical protein